MSEQQELFARRHRVGWDSWGNEVDSHVSLDMGAAASGDPSEDGRGVGATGCSDAA